MSKSAKDLDQSYFTDAAVTAASCLQAHGVAHVVLSPDDGTMYRFIIVAPDPEGKLGEQTNDYWVTLTWGASYPWPGWRVDPIYATEKWTHDRKHEWTGVVVSRFLTTLADEIRALG